MPPHTLITTLPQDPPDLLTAIRRTMAHGLQSGALRPIQTQQILIEEQGLPFTLRWVSSLAEKNTVQQKTDHTPQPHFNPFLPPEADLTVAALGAHHLVVLNKYPVMSAHALIITRTFEPQSTILAPTDLAALSHFFVQAGGLGFYNSGKTAGASQPHRHLQWIPDTAQMEAFTRALPETPGLPQQHPLLPWAHAFLALPPAIWTQTDGTALYTLYNDALHAVGLTPDNTATLPPYNLLLTRSWLLIVPRSQEHWQHISINALGYGGSFFISGSAQLEMLRKAGPLHILKTVGLPLQKK